MQLRDYQTRDYAAIREALAASPTAVYVSPTGSGKTTVVCKSIEADLAEGLRVGFVAHRKELIDQCHTRLAQNGITAGIIMAGRDADPAARVQVCSIQTLIRREAPQLDRLYVDEAHHAPSDSYRRIMQTVPSILGLTATPCRMDGRGLGDCFARLIIGSTAKQLTQSGWLVPARVFAPARPALDNVHSRGGDYIAAELQAVMDRPQITGDIVAHWLRLAAGRQTVVYATGVQHSLDMVAAFTAAGVRAVHLDADTPKDERERILAELAVSRVDVVSNCGILTEGWDCPSVSCIVLARPTRSLALYLQMVGRALRPAPGKTDCLVLDHAGATLRHGFVTEDREWTLDPSVRKASKDDSPSVRLCLNCYMAYESLLVSCPSCGWTPPIQAREVRQTDGELTELTEVKPLSRNPMIAQLQRIQRERGYKAGWLFYQMQRIRRGQKPDIPDERNRNRKGRIVGRKQNPRSQSMAAKHRRRLQSRRLRSFGKGAGRAARALRRSRRSGHHGRYRPWREEAGDRSESGS